MKKPLLMFLLSMMATPVFSLEIPLTGAGGSGEGSGGGKIAFIDLDRIFQIYPQTKAAKEDYRKKLDKMKQDLAAREAAIGGIRDKIAVLDSTLKNIPLESTDTASAQEPTSVLEMKKELEAKELEYEEARKRAEEDLAAFENNQSQLILGKIYQAMRDLAEETQVTLIVDKSSILYGSATIDLTDQLQERVRGF